MADKCHQCGEEIEKYIHPYVTNNYVELCENCGYVRKIAWYQIDINRDFGKIIDIVENEKVHDKEKIQEIQKVFE